MKRPPTARFHRGDTVIYREGAETKIVSATCTFLGYDGDDHAWVRIDHIRENSARIKITESARKRVALSTLRKPQQ